MNKYLIAALKQVVAAYEEAKHDVKQRKYRDYKLDVQEDWHEKGEEVDDGEYNMTVIYAEKNGRNAAYAEFIHRDDGSLLTNNVEVKEIDQRLGIATALYVQAEYETGRTIKPHNIQSPEGQALWNQKNRPFG